MVLQSSSQYHIIEGNTTIWWPRSKNHGHSHVPYGCTSLIIEYLPANIKNSFDGTSAANMDPSWSKYITLHRDLGEYITTRYYHHNQHFNLLNTEVWNREIWWLLNIRPVKFYGTFRNDTTRNTDKDQPLQIPTHYSDVIMSRMASQITSVSTVCSILCSGAHQRNNQISASLAFVRRNHRWSVDSSHKRPVTRKSFHLLASSCYKHSQCIRYNV